MYINQLSQEKQDFVKSRVEYFIQATGLEGTLLAEAIEHAMNSKVDDLDEILSYDERKSLGGKDKLENLEFDLTHQTAYGRSYMWAYHIYEGSKCVLSGGVYASQYPTRESALEKVKRELKSRMK